MILMAAWGDYSDEQRLAFIAESVKPKALIIDLVGNVYLHNVPDAPHEWNLDGREKRSRSVADGVPMRTCLADGCWLAYERIYTHCPYCGEPAPEPLRRDNIQNVDGCLFFLTPETLAAMRGEVFDPYAPLRQPPGLPEAARYSLAKKHGTRVAAHIHLQEAIAWWAGMYPTESQQELERRFYFTFGKDILTALKGSAKEAEALTVLVRNKTDER